jgi:hypothetical protein
MYNERTMISGFNDDERVQDIIDRVHTVSDPAWAERERRRPRLANILIQREIKLQARLKKTSLIVVSIIAFGIICLAAFLLLPGIH